MPIRDESWRGLVDWLSEFLSAGAQTKGSTGGDWVTMPCGLPEHGGMDKNASARLCLRQTITGSGVSHPGHYWCGKCGGMDGLAFLAKMTGRPEREIFAELAARYSFPRTPEEPRRRGEKERRPKVTLGDLPDKETLHRYKEALFSGPDGQQVVDYFGRRGISKETLQELEIGFNDYKVVVIRRDMKGDVVNLWHRTVEEGDERPKLLPVTGRPNVPFPLNKTDLVSGKLVIAEGFPDVLALWEIGVHNVLTLGSANAHTYAALQKYLPTGEGSIVYIALDHDSPGKKYAGKLYKKIIEIKQTETVVMVWKSLPLGYDVNQYLLTGQDKKHRIDLWESLLQRSRRWSIHDKSEMGVMENEGQLVWEQSQDVIAHFTGKVSSCGTEKLGAVRGSTIYGFNLIHTHGDTLHVIHKMGDSFEKSIQSGQGPVHLFKFQRRYEDLILTFLINAADPDIKQQDIGWIFGFDATNGSREMTNFYTPKVLFTPEGPVRQDNIEIKTPHEVFDHVRIPFVDKDRFREALTLLWHHVYPCHRPDVMGPLLSSAFLAPLRAKFFPHLPRFPVIVYGPSGSGKTSRCRLIQSLFGDFRADVDLLSWRSTYKAIEHLTGLAGDMWILVDEMQVDKMSSGVTNEAMEFLKSIPQGIGRVRMKMTGAGITESPSAPTSIVALTMEVLPFDDEGLISRCLLVLVPRTNLMNPELRDHTETVWASIGKLPEIMSVWIETFTQSGGWFQKDITKRYLDARRFCDRVLEEVCPRWMSLQNASRLVNRLEALTSVWFTLIQLSIIEGVLSDGDAAVLTADWESSTKGIIERCVVNHSSSNLGKSFTDVIAGALQSGGYHIMKAGRGATSFGQIPTTVTPNSHLVGYFRSKGRTTEHSIAYRGQHIELAIAYSASRLLGPNPSMQWKVALGYMRNAELLQGSGETERVGSRSNNRERVVWLSHKGAELLLQGVEGVDVGEEEENEGQVFGQVPAG